MVGNAAKGSLLAQAWGHSEWNDDLFVFEPAHLRGPGAAVGGGGYDGTGFPGPGSVDAAGWARMIDTLTLSDLGNFLKLAGNDLFAFAAGATTADDTVVGSSGDDGSTSETVPLNPANETGGGGSNDTPAASPTTTAPSGVDPFVGGAGNDHFVLSGTDFVSIDGNGGIDYVILSASFDQRSFNLGTVAARLHDVEVISLEQAEGVTLRVSDTNVPLLNDQDILYVLGDFDDEIILEGDWSLVSATTTNAAVAPGVNFVHLVSAGGADLYVDGAITQPPVAWATSWEELITPLGVGPL